MPAVMTIALTRITAPMRSSVPTAMADDSWPRLGCSTARMLRHRDDLWRPPLPLIHGQPE